MDAGLPQSLPPTFFASYGELIFFFALLLLCSFGHRIIMQFLVEYVRNGCYLGDFLLVLANFVYRRATIILTFSGILITKSVVYSQMK